MGGSRSSNIFTNSMIVEWDHTSFRRIWELDSKLVSLETDDTVLTSIFPIYNNVVYIND